MPVVPSLAPRLLPHHRSKLWIFIYFFSLFFRYLPGHIDSEKTSFCPPFGLAFTFSSFDTHYRIILYTRTGFLPIQYYKILKNKIKFSSCRIVVEVSTAQETSRRERERAVNIPDGAHPSADGQQQEQKLRGQQAETPVVG